MLIPVIFQWQFEYLRELILIFECNQGHLNFLQYIRHIIAYLTRKKAVALSFLHLHEGPIPSQLSHHTHGLNHNWELGF
jgi:hypothetical protein